MTTRHVVMISSISGIFGVMMGVLVASWAWLGSNADFARSGAVARAEASIAKKAALLAQLRAGHYTDATRELEASLDADVARAAELARDGVAISVETLNAVEAERKARHTKTSYESAPALLDREPESFLSLPPSEMGGYPAPVVSQGDGR